MFPEHNYSFIKKNMSILQSKEALYPENPGGMNHNPFTHEWDAFNVASIAEEKEMNDRKCLCPAEGLHVHQYMCNPKSSLKLIFGYLFS